MKHRLWCLLVLGLLVIILPTSAQGIVKKWTFMVYIAGDNDLEPFGINDVEEMAKVGSSDDVNIVVEFDRAVGYDDERWGGWTDTRRYYITQTNDLKTLKPLRQGVEINSGDPRYLVDFGTWAIQNYPAENYVLIIWNHGGGWGGIGPDESNKPGMLSLTEIDQALGEIRAKTGLDKFAIVAFDACLMSQLEVYRALKNHAHYSVAAEEVIPGNGQDYIGILSQLVANPDMSTVELTQVFVDTYMTYYNEYGKMYPSYDLHAVDLSKVDAVAEALAAFSQAGIANMEAILSSTGVARNSAQFFSYAHDILSVDIVDFMQIFVEANLPAAVETAAQGVIDAVYDAIVHTRTTPNMPGANGIAFYFPLLSESFKADDYRAQISAPMDEWAAFLENFHSTAKRVLEDNNLTVTMGDVVTLTDSVSTTYPAAIKFMTTGTGIIDMEFYAAFAIDESTKLLVATFPIAIYSYNNDGKLLREYPEGDYESYYVWDVRNTVVTLGDGSSFPVLLEYGRGSSAGQARVRGVYCFAKSVDGQNCVPSYALFDTLTQQVQTYWINYEFEGGASSTSQISVSDGDTFSPFYNVLSEEGTQQLYIDTSFWTIDTAAPVAFTYAPAFSGEYTASVLVKDLSGRTAVGSTVFTVDNETANPNVRSFLDFDIGVTFYYPIHWGDATTQYFDDGLWRAYINAPNGELSVTLEPYQVNSLDEALATLQTWASEFATLQEPVAFELWNELPAYIVDYVRPLEDGGESTGAFMVVYSPNNELAYLIDVYTEDIASYGDLLVEVFQIVRDSIEFFTPIPIYPE